ncbi:UNVERIFIED_CONTAM: hypothetical protein Slati_3817700 [Sesamum latifolium]|uniref:Transposase-associated domain-containing protein n=1 Tax=Sesamum latifolium TaxID=2727402 RepID=A0AAW2U5U0_9LAMI
MYKKNLPNKVGLTPQFQDGVTAFIEWAKSHHAYMDGEKIRCPCRTCKNEIFETPDEVNFDLYIKDFMSEYYNWTLHGEERVPEYFEAITAPPSHNKQTLLIPTEEGTSTHWGDATQMNWAHRMVFDATGPTFWSSTYNQDGAPDEGKRSCPLDAGPSSYYYGRSPYDYVSGLVDRFHDVVHAAEQPLWNGCNTSQLRLWLTWWI